MSGGTPPNRGSDEDALKSGLTFTDVLFGLVIAEVFQRLDEISQVSAAGQAHLLLAFVLTTTSYIGYHNSKKRSDYPIRFFNLPLMKFALDMSMVAMYWLLAAKPEGLPTSGSSSPQAPDAFLDSTVILVVFSLYVAWDVASYCMYLSDTYPGARYNQHRTIASVGASGIAFAVWLLVIFSDCDAMAFVVGVDFVLISLLIVYRYAKDRLPAPATRSGGAV